MTPILESSEIGSGIWVDPGVAVPHECVPIDRVDPGACGLVRHFGKVAVAVGWLRCHRMRLMPSLRLDTGKRLINFEPYRKRSHRGQALVMHCPIG